MKSIFNYVNTLAFASNKEHLFDRINEVDSRIISIITRATFIACGALISVAIYGFFAFNLI